MLYFNKIHFSLTLPTRLGPPQSRDKGDMGVSADSWQS